MPKNNFTDSYSSVIFPEIPIIPQKLQHHREREEVIADINSDANTADIFYSLNPEYQEAFISFCMGNRGLKITYDPFFRNIFSPEKHPGRLDMLLSAILGQPVTVKCVLSSGRIALSEKSSLMLMDILVETDDGAIINVEMQKLGYRFPMERAFCYASDIMVRQYDRLKEQLGKEFSYRKVKPVYVIVFMENSPIEFRGMEDCYIHHSFMSFDTGLKLNDLTKFIFISLDNFLNMRHNIGEQTLKERTVEESGLTMLDAWLLLFSSDRPEDVYAILEKSPVFGEIYRDIVNFQFYPKELIGMYSEALRIMDQNTIKFMIDEQKEIAARRSEEIAKQGEEIARQNEEIAKQGEEIARQDEKIAKQSEEIARQDEKIAKQSEEIARQGEEIARRSEEIAKQSEELTQKDAALEQKDSIIARKDIALKQKDDIIDELRRKLDELQNK